MARIFVKIPKDSLVPTTTENISRIMGQFWKTTIVFFQANVLPFPVGEGGFTFTSALHDLHEVKYISRFSFYFIFSISKPFSEPSWPPLFNNKIPRVSFEYQRHSLSLRETIVLQKRLKNLNFDFHVSPLFRFSFRINTRNSCFVSFRQVLIFSRLH